MKIIPISGLFFNKIKITVTFSWSFLEKNRINKSDRPQKVELHKVALVFWYNSLEPRYFHRAKIWETVTLTNDFIPLINVVSSWKHDSPTDHFPHDAPHGPDVDVLPVAHAQDDLWSSVISCYHVWSHHERCACWPGQTKVKNFERAIWPDHNITRF